MTEYLFNNHFKFNKIIIKYTQRKEKQKEKKL